MTAPADDVIARAAEVIGGLEWNQWAGGTDPSDEEIAQALAAAGLLTSTVSAEDEARIGALAEVQALYDVECEAGKRVNVYTGREARIMQRLGEILARAAALEPKP